MWHICILVSWVLTQCSTGGEYQMFWGNILLHLQDQSDYGEDEGKCRVTRDMVT